MFRGITLFLLVVSSLLPLAITVVTSSKEIFLNEQITKERVRVVKLSGRGILFIVCAVTTLILAGLQYWIPLKEGKEKDKKSVKSTIKLIETKYSLVEYQLNLSSIESNTRIDKMNTILHEVQSLIKSEENNSFVEDHKVVAEAFRNLDESLKKQSFPLSGYNAKPVQEMKDNLALSLRTFISDMQTYFHDLGDPLS